MSVCAVVVTFNRRELLVQCLAALETQTRQPDHVLVVDNASTDGTRELLRDQYADRVELVALPANVGGAGGFHEGLRLAHAAGHEWAWLMDDDTLPAPTALDELLAGGERSGAQPPSILASTVVWKDDRLHPMNAPLFEIDDTAAVLAASQQGLMPLRFATFVSLLIHRGAVDRHGLPLARYFLWSDDVEYTARILRTEPGFLVADSIALHATARPYTAIGTTDDRFYFHVRNTLYMLRGPAWATRNKPGIAFRLILTSASYLGHHRLRPRHVRIVLRGLRDGVRRGAPVATRP
jgi:rhamnopyranosyl-N-acetylglucosaminyl-diphospho-decaprenol beta-1,3/1,4-galactofuranosyltransferase